MRTQQGSLFKSHGSWFVRYRETGNNNPIAHRLASLAEYPKKSEVVPLKHEYMDRLNRISFASGAGVTITEFVEKVYFPAIEKRLTRSSVKGYKDVWHCHIRHRVASMRVRDFRTVDGTKLLKAVESEHGNNLAHGTYKWIKSSVSAIFTHAKNEGVYDGMNPMTGVYIPKGKRHGRKRLAYTLEEVEQHLELFSGVRPIVISTEDRLYTPEISQGVIRAVIGVAAFAGLREGELRGQWWEDDDGDVLNIKRSVWRTHLKDETKTHEDDDDPGIVPIIKPLRFVLDAIKPENASGWMFPNTIGGALDLDNLADRVIKPVLSANGLNWKGWHAYRRGLATNLHELGVLDKVIQAILRHEDVSTTQRSYIKTVPQVVSNAMYQLEQKIARAAVVQQA
jgi:integrase